MVTLVPMGTGFGSLVMSPRVVRAGERGTTTYCLCLSWTSGIGAQFCIASLNARTEAKSENSVDCSLARASPALSFGNGGNGWASNHLKNPSTSLVLDIIKARKSSGPPSTDCQPVLKGAECVGWGRGLPGYLPARRASLIAFSTASNSALVPDMVMR